MTQLYTNGASALLQTSLSSSATQITLGGSDGDLFPLPSTDEFSILTLEDVSGNYEIVRMTERSGNLLTIVRGQEGTTPLGFNAGDRVELRLTAGSLTSFLQDGDQYDLRGTALDTSEIRIWHDDDPSTYQYYRLRYFTSSEYGLPFFLIEPPPSVQGLVSAFSVNDADGIQRFMSLLQDNGSAPGPGTGEVMSSVPGHLRYEEINRPFSSFHMHAMWQNYPGEGYVANRLLHWPAAGDFATSYHYVCRAEDGTERFVKFNPDGSFECHNQIEFTSRDQQTYPGAGNVRLALTADIGGAAAIGELMAFNRYDGVNWPSRTLRYAFECIAPDPDGPEATRIRVPIFEDGQLKLKDENSAALMPVDDEDVTTKAYVDAAVGSGDASTSLFGRTTLWTDGGGQGTGTHSLTVGAFSDYQMIEILSREDGVGAGPVSVLTMNAQSFIDVGSNGVNYAQVGGADKGIITYTTDTSFTLSQLGTASSVVTRITGMFPKVP